MLTKYQITIDKQIIELNSETIRNWDAIECAWSRKDYMGVIRSFSSKFEFVGEAYDLLLDTYLKDGFKAEVIISVFTIDDNWRYHKQFDAQLDFSTAAWDGMVFSVSAIDNSLEGKIKARKTTKYELTVGKDIPTDGVLLYDRMSMPNEAAFEIMDTCSSKFNDACVSLCNVDDWTRLPVYVVGEGQTFEDSPFSFRDQTTGGNGHFLRFEKSEGEVELTIEINYHGHKYPSWASVRGCEIILLQYPPNHPELDETYVEIARPMQISYTDQRRNKFLGFYPSYESLVAANPDPIANAYAAVGTSDRYDDCSAVYYTPSSPKLDGQPYTWYQGTMSCMPNSNRKVYCADRKWIRKFTLANKPVNTHYCLMYRADIYTLTHNGTPNQIGITSKITANWKSKAKPIRIDAISPKALLKTMMDKMCEKNLLVSASIADTDPRLAKTYILAGESVRGLPEAKLYTTFNEFCDWMETVFGYTYRLSQRQFSPFNGVVEFVNIIDNTSTSGSTINPSLPIDTITEVTQSQISTIFLLRSSGMFVALDKDGGKYYTKFPNHNQYNDPSTSKIYADKIYKCSNGHAYYLKDGSVEVYEFDESTYFLDRQSIEFVHRDSLFTGNPEHNISEDVSDFKYSVNKGNIYSSIEIGYDKQDYDAACGRDEWNFTVEYDTNITVASKKLTLKSKYRPDCYGLEFLSQERCKDTTDDKSDTSVFFVYCKKVTTVSSAEDADSTSQEIATASTFEVAEETSGKQSETSNINPSSGGTLIVVPYDPEDPEPENESRTYETHLEIDRSATISGVLTDTVFGAEYSPIECLKANGKYIAAMGTPLILHFASFSGNSDVVINGKSVTADITLENRLFTLGELSFACADIQTTADPEALITIKYHGLTYKGFLASKDIRFGRPESVKYKLIVKSVEK